MFVVVLIDPLGQLAGKSYSPTSGGARDVGLRWRNEYKGNTFTVEREATRLAAEIMAMQS